MELVCDLGNTGLRLACFSDGKLLRSKGLGHAGLDDIAALREFLEPMKRGSANSIEAAILGSSNPQLTSVAKHALEEATGRQPLPVTRDHFGAMIAGFPGKTTVGVDRLANAYELFGRHRQAAIVVDLGTATTWDAVGSEGQFAGGLIAPGLAAHAKSLELVAPHLPSVPVDMAPPTMQLMATSTAQALQGGTIDGYATMIGAITQRLQRELGAVHIGSTGGQARHLLSRCSCLLYHDPDLTVRGYHRAVFSPWQRS